MKSKPTTLHLSAALRALTPILAGQLSGIPLDPRARAAIAADGTAIAIIPFSEGFTLERHRFIPAGPEYLEADKPSSVKRVVVLVSHPDQGARTVIYER